MVRRAKTDDDVVLVAVLKDRRDLAMLRRGRWYRIPLRRCPTRRFDRLAFYQPAGFGRAGGARRRKRSVAEHVRPRSAAEWGGRILFHARVTSRRLAWRRDLLPDEIPHPRSRRAYLLCRVGPLLRLPRPIVNDAPRRVTFAYTTFGRLRAARDLLGLFGVPPIERLLERALKAAGLPAAPQVTVSGLRVRPDLTVICRRGRIAVECDGAWHDTPRQRSADRLRDRALAARGWTVLRFREDVILSDPAACVRRVRDAALRLGGARKP